MEGIAKFLPAAVRQQLFRSDASLLELLKPLWGKMVGQGIARQCRPIDFAAGTLTIVTSCPTWAVQFRNLNAEIRTNINKFLGGDHIKKLRVRVDPSFQAPTKPEKGPSVRAMVRPHVKAERGAPQEPGDPMGILKQSYDKYFSRDKKKAN